MAERSTSEQRLKIMSFHSEHGMRPMMVETALKRMGAQTPLLFVIQVKGASLTDMGTSSFQGPHACNTAKAREEMFKIFPKTQQWFKTSVPKAHVIFHCEVIFADGSYFINCFQIGSS